MVNIDQLKYDYYNEVATYIASLFNGFIILSIMIHFDYIKIVESITIILLKIVFHFVY